MAKFTGPPATLQSLLDLQRQAVPQSLLDLQHQLNELAERWRNHPLMYEDQEKLRQLAEALGMRSPPQSAAPQSKRKRRKGGGRNPALSADTIKRLRPAYQAALQCNPRLAMTRLACKFLRKRLPEAERDASVKTLCRHIIKPIRTK